MLLLKYSLVIILWFPALVSASGFYSTGCEALEFASQLEHEKLLSCVHEQTVITSSAQVRTNCNEKSSHYLQALSDEQICHLRARELLLRK